MAAPTPAHASVPLDLGSSGRFRAAIEHGNLHLASIAGTDADSPAQQKVQGTSAPPAVRPDFFIVGAPKSGTTALAAYLGRHPEIFMPRRKDMSFFGRDLLFQSGRVTAMQYENEFYAARSFKRVGEASIWYLYSRTAAAEIREYNQTASIIALLRNPIDMIFAQHSEFLFNLNEDIEDFEEALGAEEDRKRGRRIPPTAHFPAGLLYRETARYTDQVRRYIDTFGRDRVHVIVFDDFVKDTGTIFRRTLEFLEVDPSFETEFEIVNPNKVVRSRSLQKLLVNPPRVIRKGERVIPGILDTRLMALMRRLNARHRARSPMDQETRSRLAGEFLPEVQRLSELIGRDLTGWCRVEETAA